MFPRLVSLSRHVRTPLPRVSRRCLSSTIPRRASEPTFPPGVDPAALEALRRSPVYQKLSKSPEALAALIKFSEVMVAQGMDPTSGKQPSMLQMGKMFLKPEVREAAQGLAEVFQKAGIDLNNKDVVNELSLFAKLVGSGGSKS